MHLVRGVHIPIAKIATVKTALNRNPKNSYHAADSVTSCKEESTPIIELCKTPIIASASVTNNETTGLNNFPPNSNKSSACTGFGIAN